MGTRFTNSSVSVQNGLFTTPMTLDVGLFNRSDRWLEIAVRSNGLDAFVVLSPRQQFTASAYAAYAYNAGSLSGILNGSQIAPGTISSTQIVAGAIGTAHLAPGTAAAILSNAPSLTTTNAGVDPYRGIIISNGIVRLPASCLQHLHEQWSCEGCGRSAWIAFLSAGRQQPDCVKTL